MLDDPAEITGDEGQGQTAQEPESTDESAVKKDKGKPLSYLEKQR